MYKIVLSHEILPGRLPEITKWLQGNYDKQREENPELKVPGDPDYDGPLRQYITVYGSVYQYVVEFETEEIPEHIYALSTHNANIVPFIVPGRSENKVLKQLEFK
jgi:hypothetical protein